MISSLARVEVPAALWRKVRAGELSVGDVEPLLRHFTVDLMGTVQDPPRFGVVATNPRTLDRAAEICGSHRLRAYDAVQLASAAAAREADSACAGFACFDRDLRDAASASGFELIP